jgi:hypothetical protein
MLLELGMLLNGRALVKSSVRPWVRPCPTTNKLIVLLGNLSSERGWRQKELG